MKLRSFAVRAALCLLCALTLAACSRRPEEPVLPEDAVTAEELAAPLPTPSPSPCARHRWQGGVCRLCGALCSHPGWKDGKCTECGEPCPHGEWTDGVCALCGEPCLHGEWEEGTCTVCGAKCSHGDHDPDTGLCLACGLPLRHRYIGGVCSCGAVPCFEADDLPEEFRKPCRHAGTVELVSYSTRGYHEQEENPTAEPWEKEMAVYLPYGYDESKQYDVVVLLHGLCQMHMYWLYERNEYREFSGELIRTADVLDNMIERGLCPPVIVVAPTFYKDEADISNYDPMYDGRLFWPELRYSILPYVVEHYATYAGGDMEAVPEQRAHFAYAGLSMGSIIGFQSVISHCLDCFAYLGCYSGFGWDVPTVGRDLAAWEERGYPLYYLFNCCGSRDAAYNEHKIAYKEMTEAGMLEEGVNTDFVVEMYAAHEYTTWILGLYNSLQVFFAYTDPVIASP